MSLVCEIMLWFEVLRSNNVDKTIHVAVFHVPITDLTSLQVSPAASGNVM